MRKLHFYKELLIKPMFTYIFALFYKFYDYITSTQIKYYSKNPNFSLSKAHPSDACFDLQSNDDFVVAPNSKLLITTGIFLELPKNWEAQIRSRSGLANKYDVFVLNSPGTIDEGYRGEIKVILRNNDLFTPFTIKKGDRIAQIKFDKVPKVRLLNTNIDFTTDRGSKGFGSSGR